MPSLVACAFVSNATVRTEDIQRLAWRIYPYIAAELFLRWTEDELPGVVRDVLTCLERQGLIESNADGTQWHRPPPTSEQAMQLSLVAQATIQTIERYYLEAKPGQWTLRAGCFGMPLVASEMLWDRDIQTPGLAAAWEIPAGGSATLTFAAGGFFGPQREGDRTRIGAGQLVFRSGDPSRLAVEVAGSYWHFDPRDLKPSFIRQNYSVPVDGGRDYLSRFHIVDAIVRLRFPVAGLPVTVGLDGAVNLGVAAEASDDKSALEGTVSIGRLGTPGDWRVFYIYQYVERDAVLGAYSTDDWWFHSWHRGSRLGVAYTVLPQTFVQTSLVFQKRLDLKNTLNRVIVDLVKMF